MKLELDLIQPKRDIRNVITIILNIKSHIKKIEDNLENPDILVEQSEQIE